jgi:peptide-methionine (S)-S-oxide reductase
MTSKPILRTAIHSLLLLVGVAATSACVASSKPIALPDPKIDAPRAAGNEQIAVFAGGCFWGVEAVFEHTKGVKRVESGYSGGSASTAQYELVGSGRTGHAESVRIVYDPAQVSYGQLLKVFFSVAHDPTQLNRQGPDSGTQYRSGIFTTSELQKKIATAYITQLDAAKRYAQPIVTKVEPLKAFYPAEDYHQDYARLNPNQPYIVINDAPKVVALQKLLPALYRPR